MYIYLFLYYNKKIDNVIIYNYINNQIYNKNIMNKNINISEIKQIISPDDLLLKYAPSENDINFISEFETVCNGFSNVSDRNV